MTTQNYSNFTKLHLILYSFSSHYTIQLLIYLFFLSILPILQLFNHSFIFSFSNLIHFFNSNCPFSPYFEIVYPYYLFKLTILHSTDSTTFLIPALGSCCRHLLLDICFLFTNFLDQYFLDYHFFHIC